MKKFFGLFLFVLMLSFTTFAQVGVVKSIALRTLTNTTAASDVITLTANNTLVIQVLCTQLTGTSAGVVTIMGSVDGTSYKGLTDYDGVFNGFSNDTLTITNGAIGQWVIPKSPFKYYKISYAPSGTHTTRVTAKYIYK